MVGVEPTGLWLDSADLWRIACPDAERLPGAVFVPFTHIAYLIEAPAAPPRARPDPPARDAPQPTKRSRAPGRAARR